MVENVLLAFQVEEGDRGLDRLRVGNVVGHISVCVAMLLHRELGAGRFVARFAQLVHFLVVC